MGCGQSGEVGGRSAIPLPGFIRRSIIQAMSIAEKKLGRPVTYIEIHATAVHYFGNWGFKWIYYGYTVAFI